MSLRHMDEFLARFRSTTGFPAAAAAEVVDDALVINYVSGGGLEPLRGTRLAPGEGLGGRALLLQRPVQVSDYAKATGITHDHDDLVRRLRLHAIVAVPVVVDDVATGVVYGGQRSHDPISDAQIDKALRLVNDHRSTLFAGPTARAATTDELRDRLRRVRVEAAAIAREVTEPRLRARLQALVATAGMPESAAESELELTSRQLEVVVHVAAGRSNVEVAEQLGLAPGTVKAYLRSAMRRAGVHNRTALVDVCRRSGLL